MVLKYCSPVEVETRNRSSLNSPVSNKLCSLAGWPKRTFSLKIVTNSGPEHMFLSINTEELDPMETYLKKKKIRIKEILPDADSVDLDEDKRPRIKIKSAKDDDEDSSEDDVLHLAPSIE
ncbi:hypothetical protein DFH09DRAFT_1115523 [Mycena vulgaris]|nr:hypothetical protein DFH09DRAFT_1115523 [Mycena vulgaris]